MSGATRSARSSTTSLVYNPADYGIVDPTGGASSFDAVQAAVTAAFVTGGVVQLPPGTLLWTKVGASGLDIPANPTKHVTIRGAGRIATIIKTNSTTPAFINPIITVLGGSYGKVTVEDLTVDAQNFTSVGPGVVVNCSTSEINVADYEDWTFRRVDTINCGSSSVTGGLVGGNGRRSFNFAHNRTVINPATLRYIRRIKIEDCIAGRSGGGGNSGIAMFGFTSVAKNLKDVYVASGGSNICGTVVDDIYIRNFKYDAGKTPTGSASSSGIQTGGDGVTGRIKIDGAELLNGGDVAIELDSYLNAQIENVTATNFYNQPFLFLNIGGDPPYVKSRLVMRNCTAVYTALKSDGTPNDLTFTAGYYVQTRQPAFTPTGQIIFENCEFIDERSSRSLVVSPSQPAWYLTGFRDLAMKNCRWRDAGYTAAATANNQARTGSQGVRIQQVAEKARISIENFHFDIDAVTIDAATFTGSSQQWTGINLAACVDSVIDIRGLTWRDNITTTGAVSTRVRAILMPSTFSVSDDNSSDRVSKDFIVDGGPASDLAVSGGVITSAVNHGVEKRMRWIGYSNGTSDVVPGPFTDGWHSMKFTPGPTLSGLKAGVLVKAQDASNYLEAYVTDDGANSYLNVDKVVAGVRTNLGISAALATRVSNGTAFWVSGKIIDSVVTADYYTTAPSAATGVANVGAATVTVTLTGTDKDMFGPKGKQGRGGFVWTPTDAAATADDLTYRRCHVLRGSISGLHHYGSQQSVSEQRGIQDTVTTAAGRRIERLRVRECDFSRLGPATLATEFAWADTAGKANIVQEGNTYLTLPTATSISTGTLASGGTWQNTLGYAVLFSITGGTTVTGIALSQDGGSTFTTVATAAGSVIVRPGEYVKPTYTGSPTMTALPYNP